MKNWHKYGPQLKREIKLWVATGITLILAKLGFLAWVWLDWLKYKTHNPRVELIIFGIILLAGVVAWIAWTYLRLDKLQKKEETEYDN